MKLVVIGASRGAGRLVLEEALRRGHAVTALVRESALDWTLVHPPMLVNGAPRGRFQVGEELRLSSFARIPRADLARFLLDEVEQATWRGRAVAVAEP